MIGTKLNNEGHFSDWLKDNDDILGDLDFSPPDSYPAWLVPTWAKWDTGKYEIGIQYFYPENLQKMLENLQ